MPQKKRAVQIGVSDESPFIISSIQSILAVEFLCQEMCTYPVDAETLLMRLKEHTPDILIIDFRISFERNDFNGIRKIEKIHNQLPELKIIVFTAQTNPAILQKALQVPVNAIVSKRDDCHELVQALRWILSRKDGTYYSEQMKHLMSDHLTGSVKTLLSPSELEVIRLFAIGYSLMDIAKVRQRSVSTVATQKYNAMRKLQLHSNTELIKYVFAQELI
ncbi:response regulator transcription factor [Pantoea piersonii]|uniref:response regulator transcription factor n=1 Tax=Pantoea piersonii TaxID=2364647 RepID=UPI0028A26765|nr:response regulator transcription factor [Pantoea piersonii]